MCVSVCVRERERKREIMVQHICASYLYARGRERAKTRGIVTSIIVSLLLLLLLEAPAKL